MPPPVLSAYHGDSWLSPPWAIIINGDTINAADWHIRAQARKSSASPEATLSWETGDGNVLLGSATVRTKAGIDVSTSTVQLRLRPTDWTGKPHGWSGLLDVELSSDDTEAPEYRYTVVRRRPFQIVSDVAS